MRLDDARASLVNSFICFIPYLSDELVSDSCGRSFSHLKGDGSIQVASRDAGVRLT